MEKNISKIKARILEHIECEGLSKRKFYLKTGIANGVLDKETGLSEDNIEKYISAFPDINADWLLTGKGSMFRAFLDEKVVVTGVREGRTMRRNGSQLVPLYNISATAGIVELMSGDMQKKLIPIDFISIPNLPKCDGALPVTGDSMYPLLKSGDIALYKEVHNRQNVIWGEMYLVAIQHEGDEFFFAKYLQRSTKEGWVKLVSQNQHHQDKEFPMDSIKALALIKATIRINTAF